MFDITSILEPNSLSEAIEMFSTNPNLRIIAGGTDVLIRLRHGGMESVELLSLRNVKDLYEIKLLEDGTISIGAMASFSDIFRNEIVNKYIPVLGDAAVSMGGPQVRNMATIGGNVCNGAVSADSAPTLFAYNAILKLKSAVGEREVNIADFYAGPGKVKLNEGEILTEILITKENYEGRYGHYIKYSTRKAMDISMLGVAVVSKAKEGKFEDLRIALGVAAPVPVRCLDAEALAKGLEVSDENIKQIGNECLKASKARDSWRASKSYREHLIETLSQRAIKETLRKAGGDIVE